MTTNNVLSTTEQLTRILFIAGAESVATQLARGATRRAGESEEDFAVRKNREALYRDIAEAMSNADRVKVFEQLVAFGAMNPGCVESDPFEATIMRNKHLLNVSQVLQRIMRACTSEAFFAEKVLEMRAGKQRRDGDEPDHREGAFDESPDESDRELVTESGAIERLVPEDRDDDTAVITCRELLRRAPSAVAVIEALEALYGMLSKYSIGLQAQITGLDYAPRLLTLFSVSRETDRGQVWEECFTIEEARSAYYEAQAKRKEAQAKQSTATLKALSACFG